MSHLLKNVLALARATVESEINAAAPVKEDMRPWQAVLVSIDKLQLMAERYEADLIFTAMRTDGFNPSELALFCERECRACGCTQEKACPGGCYWVSWDLCSACVPFQSKAAKNRRTPRR